MRHTFVFLGAAVLAAGASCRGEKAGEGVRSIAEFAALTASAEAPFDASLRSFEDTAPGAEEARREAGRRALEEARKLRDILEARRTPAGLEYAAGEELVYANHLVLGLADFAQSDGGPASLETLRSVLERGRNHRDRGRAALKSISK